MKKLNAVTLAGFALCGFLLGMKALGLAEAGITLLLIVWGGYAYGAAAALGLTLYELHRENQQYKRSAKRQKVHQQPQHTVKPANRRKAG